MNIIMGEFIYLNSTIYNLSFQRELSFAFTGVSILIGIIMLFFNKPKLILPKATYYFIGAFLLFFILSAVINRANLYLAIWSFINTFKYLIYFFVLTTFNTSWFESKILTIVTWVVIFEFLMGLYSFIFYGKGIGFLEQAYLDSTRIGTGTFFGDRLFITTLGEHGILGLTFSMLAIFLFEQREIGIIKSNFQKITYKISLATVLLTVFIFIPTSRVSVLIVLLTLIILLLRKIKNPKFIVIGVSSLVVIVGLTWFYFYKIGLSWRTFSGLGTFLNFPDYIITTIKNGSGRPATYYATFLILLNYGKLAFGFGPGMSGAFLTKFESGREIFEQMIEKINYDYGQSSGALLDSQYVDLALQIGLIALFSFILFLLFIGIYCKRKGNIYPLIYIVAFLVAAITHTCWGLRSYSMIFWTALALSVNRTLREDKK